MIILSKLTPVKHRTDQTRKPLAQANANAQQNGGPSECKPEVRRWQPVSEGEVGHNRQTENEPPREENE